MPNESQPRWIADLKTGKLDERQADGSYKPAFKLMPLDSPKSVDRARIAYDTFRGGFRGDTPCPAPHWNETPAWVRDVVQVAYLQGTLDGTR